MGVSIENELLVEVTCLVMHDLVDAQPRFKGTQKSHCSERYLRV